jgi:hypothetical protein|uniref:hypothetical protein n=1 Tax=Prosthecobacter sp. TaxID=1965333 RepID=UPI003783FE5D
MDPFNTPTPPESARPGHRFWLRADGTAFEVSDHLQSAQYLKAASDEADRPIPWGYADMFRHGWMRIHIEDHRIWADGAAGHTATPPQQQWLDTAKTALSSEAGTPPVISAIEQAHEVGATTEPQTAPTLTFLQKIGFKKS